MKKVNPLSALILILTVLLGGCTKAASIPTEAVPSQYLPIRVIVNDEAAPVYISTQELGQNFCDGLFYHDIEEVTVELDGKSIPLQQALMENIITEADIFYYAQLDARSGLCIESFESYHGVTQFTYRYPEFSFLIVRDIYETPDGAQHLISSMTIYQEKPGEIKGPYQYSWNLDTNEMYDREDWGLVLEIKELSPTGVTVQCTQSGGQQIGDLNVTFFYLLDQNGFISRNPESGSQQQAIPIQMEGTSTLVFDWTTLYGALSSGSYEILLDIEDQFDQSQVHPLMVDYHQRQQYSLSFTLP